MHRNTLYRTVAPAHAIPGAGGISPRAVENRICRNDSAAARGRTSHATRAGDVSPPWFRYRDCTGVRQHTVGSLAQLCGSVLASASPESRRTDARRSRSRQKVRPSGRRVPLLKRFISQSRRADERRSLCATSAWLTKSDFCAVQTRVPSKKSGGRKPPVLSLPRLHRRPPTHRSAVCRDFAKAFLQMRLPSHGGLTPAAPAFARDECPRMCAE